MRRECDKQYILWSVATFGLFVVQWDPSSSEGGGVQALINFRQQAQRAREASRELAENISRNVDDLTLNAAEAVAAYINAGTELLRQPPQRGVRAIWNACVCVFKRKE